jgi:LPS sulfotransferase NodH
MMDNTRMYESEFALDCIFDIQPTNNRLNIKINKKYIVLSTPRSGSTLLCSALHNSKLAGVPFEYFHYSLLDKIGNPEKSLRNLYLYFHNLQYRRTSHNGVFGIKLHFLQYDRLFGNDSHGFDFLLKFDKFILTYRRDKILQAISSILAIENNVWSRNTESANGIVGRDFTSADITAISNYIQDMETQEQAWRNICHQLGIQPLEVAYEDLEADHSTEFDRICNYLDIANLTSDMLIPITVKTTNTALTFKMKQLYIDSIQ